MIRKDVLFNTHMFGRRAAPCSGVVTDVIGYHNNSGYPCIYNRKAIGTSRELNVILPLGILENPRPMAPHRVKERSIIHRSDKTIADCRIKLIKEFDFNKVRKLSEYVNKHQSLVLYFMVHSAYGAGIPTGNSAAKFLRDLKTLTNSYRYCSMSYLYYSKDKITYPRGDLRYIIYLINMPSCVPIMNRYKVDGMSVIFQIVSLSDTLSTNKITPIFNIALILSNYRENIFVIDGIDIRDQRPISDKALLIARNTIYRSIRSKDTFCMKEKLKGGKGSDTLHTKCDTYNWPDITSNSSFTTLDASSTATYYYSTSAATSS